MCVSLCRFVNILKMCDDENLAAAVIIILLSKKKRKPKPIWSKEWFKKRHVYTHERLLKDLATTQLNDFQNYLRMDIAKFEELLLLVTLSSRKMTRT